MRIIMCTDLWNTLSVKGWYIDINKRLTLFYEKDIPLLQITSYIASSIKDAVYCSSKDVDSLSESWERLNVWEKQKPVE